MAAYSTQTNESTGNTYGYGQSGSQGSSSGTTDSQGSSQGTSQSQAQSQSVSGPDPGLMQRWDTGYADHIAAHSELYNNYMAGYQDVLGRTANQADRVQSGYGTLNAQVQNQIQGIDSSRRQDIADAYAKQRGQAQTSLTARGLGNTTVRDSTDRGLVYDREKAYNQLSNQTAGLQAGYTSQLGSAGLAAQEKQLGILSSTGNSYMQGLSNYQLQALGWAPNRTDSTSQSQSQSQNTSQNTSHGENQSSNSSFQNSQNTGQNQSYGYGYSMQSNPPYISGGSGYPPPQYPPQYPPGGGSNGGGGSWDVDPVPPESGGVPPPSSEGAGIEPGATYNNVPGYNGDYTGPGGSWVPYNPNQPGGPGTPINGGGSAYSAAGKATTSPYKFS